MFLNLSRNFGKRAPALNNVLARVSSTYEPHLKSKFMQKLINKKGAKSKKQWYKPHLGEPLEVETKKPKKGISHSHSVRLRQHSHVLYDKITEILNTGELSQEILDKQVSIVSMTMHKDMNTLSIYWDADRKDSESVEQLLQAHCGKLRSLLISYHILGRIPYIVFVRDKTSVNLSQLEHLFAVADYGPDYMPGMNLDGDRQNDIHRDQTLDSKNEVEDNRNVNLLKYIHNNHTLDIQDLSEMDSFKDRIDGDGFLNSSLGNNSNSIRQQSQVPLENLNVLDGSYEKGNLDLELSTSAKELHFRSDVYGLSRDEMMKKVLAKKKKANVSAGWEKFSSPLDFDQNSDIVPSFQSPVLPKTKFKQKLVKEERRWREKMLERDDF